MLSLALAKQLPKSALLVYLFLQERGEQPVGRIADACGITIQSVYASLKTLKKILHDHANMDHDPKGTVKNSGKGEGPEASSAPVPPSADTDPLMVRLCAYDVLTWCAEMVLQKIKQGELQREDVERQLGYHQLRLDSGFKFKSHPARFLFSAILKNYAPPAEAQRQASHSGNDVRPMSAQRAPIARTFGAATLERRAEFEALERARQDDENRRRSLLAMFANQCRRERGLKRKSPEQLLPQLVKHGLTLDDLLGAIARCEAEASVASEPCRAV